MIISSVLHECVKLTHMAALSLVVFIGCDEVGNTRPSIDTQLSLELIDPTAADWVKVAELSRQIEVLRLHAIDRRDSVTNEDLSGLYKCSRIRTLVIGAPSVTDQGIAKLTSLKTLEAVVFLRLSCHRHWDSGTQRSART